MLLTCPICNQQFKKKPSAVAKIKHQPCCSILCNNELRKVWFSGEGNHQKGLKGNLNSSFKTDITIMKRGTQKYEFIYKPWHPFAESTGRLRRHRFIIEQNAYKFDEKYFFKAIINNDENNIWYVLKPKYDVHHKNKNTLDNSLSNLEIQTRGEHTRIHNLNKEITRDKQTGRIVGIVKSGELLENPEEDNQQPSVVNDIEVTTKAQRLGGEESTNNPPTSARRLRKGYSLYTTCLHLDKPYLPNL